MDFIEFLKIGFYGIVEGITEWLPISSTGHLILLEEILPLNVSENFWDLFLVVIQLGAILAVIVLFFKKLNPFAIKKTKQERKDTWNIWLKVIIGCIPIGIVGLLFDDWIDANFYNYLVVAIALIVYGILFIVVENVIKNRGFKTTDIKNLSYQDAFLIGTIQVLALIPGTSRSGSTILGGMILGTDRKTVAEYSFFLAIPAMIGASLLKILKYNYNSETMSLISSLPERLSFSTNEWATLIIGCVVAFIVSVLIIKFLMNYIKKHDFKIFGYYRIALGIIVLVYFLIFK